MALKQIEPTVAKVGGMKFYITPFPAFKAANLTGELASVLAPLLSVLAPLVNEGTGSNGEGGDNGLMDVDVGKAAEAMANCTAINGDKMEILMRKLLINGNIVVEAPNEEGDIEPQKLDLDLANEIFCGEVQDMFILCFHVIKLNFNGFFKKIAALFGKAGLADGKIPRQIF